MPRPRYHYYGKDVWEAAVAAILCGENLLLAGSKATGKNVLAENLAQVFARPGWDVSFHVNMDAAGLIGMDTFENGQVTFRPGPICAVCDAFFYRGRAAAVLGQGEYALEEARVLLPVAGSVTLLTNGQSAPENLPDGLAVDTRPVSAVEGGETVERVVFADGETLPLDGVFVALGTAGSTDFARKLGAPLDGTHIRANADGSTAVPGLFAAGDCTGGLLQIAKAVSDGAQAAMSAVKFLRK